MPADPIPAPDARLPRDLWEDLLPFVPHPKPPGNEFMLRLIAYDIADPKRLVRVADICEDYGTRVQYSLFECWLEDDAFQQLWDKLQSAINAAEDRLVAYQLDAAAAGRRKTAGATMNCTEKETFYYV
jgi:CRISPR-associated protein Cas2